MNDIKPTYEDLIETITSMSSDRDTLRSEVERLTKERDEARARAAKLNGHCTLYKLGEEASAEELSELRAKAAEDAKEIANLQEQQRTDIQEIKRLLDERDAATARATELEAACAAKDAAIKKAITAANGWPGATDYDCISETKAILNYALATTPTEHLAKLQAAEADAKRMETVEAECWDVRCVDVPTGGDDADVRWIVIEHHMAQPREREIGYGGTTPRKAIDSAIAALKGAQP